MDDSSRLASFRVLPDLALKVQANSMKRHSKNCVKNMARNCQGVNEKSAMFGQFEVSDQIL
ncbi:hypothetical protein BpHYR1_050600 [Brachionus plicatilis]|uniref:Uncharacterized protein n=1 Tax=Brachionus plicatilis TaxID=10195 RepID=A0A3M7SVD4_BRAPC|nr:hypothetical protein BpHYR1_050600 [Brachionus plicatilis]